MTEIIGEIRPGPEGEPPVFRVVRREERIYPGDTASDLAGVRACEHRQFILDEKFSTVTCQDCRERIDAFAVLMYFAEWSQRWRNDKAWAERAERQLHVTELRRIVKLRCLTDAERDELRALLAAEFRLTMEDVKALRNRFEKIELERFRARKSRKRRVTFPTQRSGDSA